MYAFRYILAVIVVFTLTTNIILSTAKSGDSAELVSLYVVIFAALGFVLGHLDGRIAQQVSQWKKKYKK
jgi:NhaP-type Na+/H+ or K+/H+ antiporter